MKLLPLLFALFGTSTCIAQFNTSELEPDAFFDIKKELYYGIPNPVSISLGKYKSAKVTVRNGIIKKTNKPGRYLIYPEGYPHSTTTVIITANNYKKEINFNVRPLAMPAIEVSGPRGQDNVIWNFKQTSGIYAYHKPMDLNVKYKIDSFAIILTDSAKIETTHINIGGEWDSVTRKLLDDAKSKTFILITNVYVTGTERRMKLDSYLQYYIR